MSLLIPLAKTKVPRQASVIFLHGLGGHPYDTWQAAGRDDTGQPPFWPVWLAQDLPGVDVYTIGYAASAVGWTGQTMPIEDRANNICALLLAQPGLSDAPIFFLCHSLGGIVLKSAMLRLKERAPHEPEAAALYAAIRKVVFLATPHLGSEKAGLMDWLRLLLWPTALTKALVSNAASLRSINTSYRLLAKERAADLGHQVFFETRSTALGRIVREGSADPGLMTVEPVGIDGDHITLVKPGSRDVLLYKSVLDFLAEGLVSDPGFAAQILPRPAYDPATQIDRLGVAVRVAVLGAGIALAWAVWPQPGSADADAAPDITKILYAIAVISGSDERLLVAERLLGRALSEQERYVVQGLSVAPELAASVDGTRIAEIARTGSVEALRAAVAELPIASCRTAADFVVVDNQLRCKSHDPIAYVQVPNKGGPLVSLEALVFHYTATSSVGATLRWFASGSGRASAHILIDRNGGVVQMVPFDISAWHAGMSWYEPLRLTGLNRYTVGVELVNLGRLKRQEDGSFKSDYGEPVDAAEVTRIVQDGKTTYWHSYTPEQIAAATGIAHAFRAHDPGILLLGHQAISPGHIDPGPAFPLDQIDLAAR